MKVFLLTLFISLSLINLLPGEEKEAVTNSPGIDSAPSLVFRPATTYPPTLLNDGISGIVKVQFTVNTSGNVQDIEVLESAHQLFTEEALKVLDQMKFKPGLKDGSPVDCKVRIPIRFNPPKVADSPDLQSAPRPLFQPAPIYPRSLRKKGISGYVKVMLTVDTSGNVKDIEVLESDHELFTEEALKVLEKWKFRPGYQAGKPVDSRIRIPIPFKIKEK